MGIGSRAEVETKRVHSGSYNRFIPLVRKAKDAINILP
jgi:hypothetical protein